MKLEKFKERNIKMKVIVFSIGGVILLLAGIYLYRTFAIFEENREFNIIKGQVPNQRYDVMLSYNVVDESGNKIFHESMPEGKDWGVSVECDHGAIGVWDYEEWAPLIKNLNDSRTKCVLNFKKPVGTLIDVIKSVPVVTSGDGLYEVSHNEAVITYTDDVTQINNLKQTELRYAGSNPNNYVIFNNELWRVIGLVNTPEGQRIKIIRNESIGSYSWDSSDSSVNNGYGVNEWSQSKLMNLLNSGAYYNRTSGICYIEKNNQIESCDFSKTGLTNYAKGMIDTVTWNLGTSSDAELLLTSNDFYNVERGNITGKACSSGSACNDTVERTLTWSGRVGLMYVSDYGYAASDQCSTKVINSEYWNSNCLDNDWMYKEKMIQWMITSRARNADASSVFMLSFSTQRASYAYSPLPTIYLKNNIKVGFGDGSIESPYELILGL